MQNKPEIGQKFLAYGLGRFPNLEEKMMKHKIKLRDLLELNENMASAFLEGEDSRRSEINDYLSWCKKMLAISNESKKDLTVPSEKVNFMQINHGENNKGKIIQVTHHNQHLSYENMDISLFEIINAHNCKITFRNCRIHKLINAGHNTQIQLKNDSVLNLIEEKERLGALKYQESQLNMNKPMFGSQEENGKTDEKRKPLCQKRECTIF